LGEAPLSAALPIFSSLASVAGREPARALLDADGAAVRLETQASALLIHGEGATIALAGAQWPGLWHYDGRKKTLGHLAQGAGLLGKGANRALKEHRAKLREGDLLVAISPSAFKDSPAFRKRLLDAILKNRAESARHLALALEKELFPESEDERLLAVLRPAGAPAAANRAVAKKPAGKKSPKKAAKTAIKKTKKTAPKKATPAKKVPSDKAAALPKTNP
ncbi:MAG: hypothetical protein J0L75_16780, partial [Spirochaetes bacterium]|nr:hypothetical protein [Spirochaetota bacterium]